MTVPVRRSIAIAAAIFIGGCDRATEAGARTALGYEDDTFASSRNERLVQGPTGQVSSRYYFPRKEEPGRLFLDLRRATFLLSNSRNHAPTPDRPCRIGDLPINDFPVNVHNSTDVSVLGGKVIGSVPQQLDWDASYCDSAGVYFKNSPGGQVDGVRIARAWDGVRIGVNSPGFVISNSWLSDMRDDAIENDYLYAGRVEDSLLDGVYQAIALRPDKDRRADVASPAGVTDINGSLIRLQEYPFRGRRRLGGFIKSDPATGPLRIRNSVIAIQPSEMQRWANSWDLTWPKVELASNNLFLWLSDAPVPSDFPLPTKGFQILNGASARAAWSKAVANWIDCHPRVDRLPDDPPSQPNRCRPGDWGGFSR
jgi:hypothetical protein